MAAYYDRGRYRGRIVAQQLGENTKGNPEVQLVVQPIAIYDDKGDPCTMSFPYTRTIFLVLTEATIGTPDAPGWVLLTLRHLGFNGTSFNDLDPNSESPWSCVGQEVDLRCDHEEYEGKEKEKWNIHRPQTGGGVARKPLEKKSLRALDSKFGKVLKATVNNTPADTPHTPTPDPDTLPGPPPTRTSEEIPF